MPLLNGIQPVRLAFSGGAASRRPGVGLAVVVSGPHCHNTYCNHNVKCEEKRAVSEENLQQNENHKHPAGGRSNSNYHAKQGNGA